MCLHYIHLLHLTNSEINSSSWLDTWNIYIATVVAHNPSRAAELLGYQRLIHSASKHFSTSAWLNYDMQFRTLAASNPQLQWNLRHSEFWLDNLASQTWPCTYCGSTSHFPDRCPRCPFRTVHLSNDNASQQIMDIDYSHAEISIISHAEISIISPANATPLPLSTLLPTLWLPHSPCIQMRAGASSPLKSRVLGPVLHYNHSSSSANLLITPTKLLFNSSFLT